MAEHELVESAGVPIDERATDKLGVIGFHEALRLGGLTVVRFVTLDSPDDDISNAHK